MSLRDKLPLLLLRRIFQAHPGRGVVAGAGLARSGFPVLGLMILVVALVIGGLLLLRAGMVRRQS